MRQAPCLHVDIGRKVGAFALSDPCLSYWICCSQRPVPHRSILSRPPHTRSVRRLHPSPLYSPILLVYQRYMSISAEDARPKLLVCRSGAEDSVLTMTPDQLTQASGCVCVSLIPHAATSVPTSIAPTTAIPNGVVKPFTQTSSQALILSQVQTPSF